MRHAFELATTEGPAVSKVFNILQKSVELGSSDIHFEPILEKPNGLKIRVRLDGILEVLEYVDKEISLQVLSRIKVMAKMDVSEKRLPQDGSFTEIFFSRNIDFRVSTFPSIYGEKIVIRILDSEFFKPSLLNLGLPDCVFSYINKFCKQLGGFFLVTGPTGSGKTTTLHSMILASNSENKNVVTLEDPVEYKIPGIVQSQIRSDIGFDFECALRSVLRQDPDVIMVGEVRDKETARAAIKAALTGHLVLSTLHTNDAPGAIMRLIDMGVESFLINSSLSAILSQRLVRKLCLSCKYERVPNSIETEFFKVYNESLDKISDSYGCSDCFFTRYKSRIGVFELMILSLEIRSLITQKPTFSQIYSQCKKEGFVSMIYDGISKVKLGITSVEELIRVIV